MELNAEEAPTYRLPTLRPANTILKSRDTLILDVVREKYFGFNAIKQIDAEAHKQMDIIKSNIPALNKNQFLTNDQRFFQKIYGNMNFGSLSAVDTAYAERNASDKKLMQRRKVDTLKENKKYSSQQVEYFREDHVIEAKKTITQQQDAVDAAKKKSEEEFEQLRQAVKEKKERNQEIRLRRKRNVMLAVDFSKQHLSVSKALQKHEFLTFKEQNMKKNADFVAQYQLKKERQNQIVRKYIEQRNVLRHLQASNDRKMIENRLKDDKEIEEFEAKKRVEYLRSLAYDPKADVNGTATSRTNNPTRILDLIQTFEPKAKGDEENPHEQLPQQSPQQRVNTETTNAQTKNVSKSATEKNASKRGDGAVSETETF